MPLKLVNAGPSPFGRKVAIALEEKNIPYEVLYDVPWGPDTCTPQYNPLAQLPILVLENGETVYESTYILEWLELTYPAPPLLPADVEGRLEAKKRQMLGEALMNFAGILMFETNRRQPSTSWFARHEKKTIAALGELERIYAGGRLQSFVANPAQNVDLGDIAVVSTIDLFTFVVEESGMDKIDALKWRHGHPALGQLSDILNKRSSFARTQPRPMEVDMGAVTA